MQSRFEAKKRTILEQLDVPEGEYHDLSPKGSVDEPIRALIHDINRLDGLVTTSSCSGRVSVFLEGKKGHVEDTKLFQGDVETTISAGPGGKGGGSWLFISHDPINLTQSGGEVDIPSLFGVCKPNIPNEEQPGSHCSYIHLKFEPMILHILTASLEHAQRVLTAALGAGFRESGAVSLNITKSGELNPMVAVRSTGYSFDAIIGFRNSHGNDISLVDEDYLRTLANVANERFNINTDRIGRFRSTLLKQFAPSPLHSNFESPASLSGSQKLGWEDPEVRRRRKKEEGLARQRALKAESNTAVHLIPETSYDAGIDRD